MEIGEAGPIFTQENILKYLWDNDIEPEGNKNKNRNANFCVAYSRSFLHLPTELLKS